MGTTILQEPLMHYNARGFKPDEELVRDRHPPSLETGPNKLLQFRAHFGWNLHLVATELPRDIDGLAVGAQELNARRTVAKMVVELTFRFRLESSLHIFEEQAFDIAAPEH
jgi:hypothetical protein